MTLSTALLGSGDKDRTKALRGQAAGAGLSRTQKLLIALVTVLVVTLFYLLLYKPKSNELAEVNRQIDTSIAQQADLRAQIEQLQEVRLDVPRLEAHLAAAESIIPHGAALPAVLRQMQQAADDSGLTLVSVVPARPTPVEAEAAPEGLATINMSVAVEGGYFQIVDFLRRIEDPTIVPRAVMWRSITVVEGPEEYPQLAASLNGDLFAIQPVPVEGATAEEQAQAEATATASPGTTPSPAPTTTVTATATTTAGEGAP